MVVGEVRVAQSGERGGGGEWGGGGEEERDRVGGREGVRQKWEKGRRDTGKGGGEEGGEGNRTRKWRVRLQKRQIRRKNTKKSKEGREAWEERGACGIPQEGWGYKTEHCQMQHQPSSSHILLIILRQEALPAWENACCPEAWQRPAYLPVMATNHLDSFLARNWARQAVGNYIATLL